MKPAQNICIADQTALHYLLHFDCAHQLKHSSIKDIALAGGLPPDDLISQLNFNHPQLGRHPITILVSDNELRRSTISIECHSCSSRLIDDSFFKLSEGLLMATPEFTFIRLANYFDEYQLIQTGIDLCAKYYLGWQTGKIRGRQDYITTPLSMADFASHANGMRGAVKTHDTLNWILANSGSPAETRLYIQFALPLRKGGFGLPLDAFNYDVRAEKLSGIMEQNEYSIDLVNSKWRIGIEYDGKDYHEDTWKDIRRRNELAVIGWRVFPTNMSTLYNPDATLRFGMQMRQVFKLRNRFPQCWEQKFEKLRTSIGLPV